MAVFDPTGWSFFKVLTIDKTKVGTITESQFTFLVDLSDLGNDFHSNVLANGNDIRVALDSDLTELNYELVNIDTTAKTGELWVQIQGLTNSADTLVRIYYGNSSAAAASTNATWDTSFKLVDHDPSIGTDSTSNANDGTVTGVVQEAVKIGNGGGFAGTDDRVDYGSAASLDNIWSGGGTISMWVKITSGTATIARMLTNKEGNTGWQLLASGEVAGVAVMTFFHRWTAGIFAGKWTFNLPTGSLQHVAVTYNKDNAINDPSVYVNGTLVPITEVFTPSGTARDDSTAPLFNGTTSALANDLDGQEDEFWVRDGEASAGFVLTAYNNQNSPSTFYSVGLQQDVLILRKGIRTVGNATILEVNVDPNGQIFATNASIALDSTNGRVFKNIDGGSTWLEIASKPSTTSDTIGTKTTTDAVTSPFAALTKTIPINTAKLFSVSVVAKDQLNSFANAYERTVRVFRFGAGAVLGTIQDDYTDEGDVAPDLTFGVSGNDLQVLVTGKTATNIDWIGRIVEKTVIGVL